ncbi:hypothetical protein BT93_I0688 [Corymbia citriodora subsp. variegata]|nr:hypothetical protein BT93_I0688 [Corymbia citriodora subsp. variegata]
MYIPSNPFEPAYVKLEEYDDNLTPVIPIVGIEEMETVSETPSLEALADKSEDKTSLEENRTESSGVDTICIGDVKIPVEDAELAAAASVMFFTILVKSSAQGHKIDTDLLVKFLHDPQMIWNFLKSKSPSPEPKQASPQVSRSSPPLSPSESKQTTPSLNMSSPELPLVESKQTCSPNLPSNSQPSVAMSRPLYPPFPLASPKRYVPALEEKSSPAAPSNPDSKKVQPSTPPASPEIVLPESQHIHPPIPPSIPEASQSVTKQICPSVPVSIPKQSPPESKQETPIPLSRPELSLPQLKQTSPPNPVSSNELPSCEPKRITPPIRPPEKFPAAPPAPANAIFGAQNQMQPPFRAPQAWPALAPLPGFDRVKAQSYTLPIRFAGPPFPTSCTVPDRPSFTYQASALPSRPIPVPTMAAERARPPGVLPRAPIPTPCTMPARPTFPPLAKIPTGPTLIPTMWASTAHPGSALPSPRVPPSSTTPTRPSFTYQVSSLPSPPLVPIMEAGKPQPVKDANYYKNLVRQHGGEKPENSVHIAPNAVNQNQPQNLTMDQKLGPKEATTLKNEKKVACMFFNSAKGCRNGSNCSYLHEMPPQQGSDNPVGEQSAKRTKFGA